MLNQKETKHGTWASANGKGDNYVYKEINVCPVQPLSSRPIYLT